MTPKEQDLTRTVAQQMREVSALKARQLMTGSALVTKFSSASKQLDAGDAVGVWLKITFNFGDGYFVGDISINDILYDNATNDWSEYFTQVNMQQTGDGKAIIYAHFVSAYGSGEYTVKVSASGNKAGSFTIEQVKTV